jgi:signal transduction histidine kinase
MNSDTRKRDASTAPAPRATADGAADLILMIRWVLIIATSYLVIFSHPLVQIPTVNALFVALYLASNIAFSELQAALRKHGLFEWSIVVFDTLAIAGAMLLTGNASGEFFILYFVVLFLSALSERIGLVAVATLLIIVTYLYTLSNNHVDLSHWMDEGHLVRIPFLFAVALFFGNLVQSARAQQRAAEEARARALRMEVLSTISHDLKNPLGVVQSLAALMLDGDAGPLNEQQTDLAHRIHASVRHALTLSQNLIDAERIEAGRLSVQRQPADLAMIADHALELARSASQLKGIEIRRDVAPGLPMAWVDSVQTERVISNLLSNAIKFTPAGGHVALELAEGEDEMVIRVLDDGPGIGEDEIARLFEKYDRGARAGGEGSGLGLFIVKAVAEAHGGTVKVASIRGMGTSVTVTLPLSAPRGTSRAPERARVVPRSATAHLIAS